MLTTRDARQTNGKIDVLENHFLLNTIRRKRNARNLEINK